MKPDEDGRILDTDEDDDFGSDSSAPQFGPKTSVRQKESDGDSVGHLSYNDLSEMFNQANRKAHRATVSVGGRNEYPMFP